MKLAEALRLGAAPQLALVGAGGKTTAMFQLARELDPPVLLTASTHLAQEQLALADLHLILRSPKELEDLDRGALAEVTLITGALGEDKRTQGLDAEGLSRLGDFAREHALPLLIEADGSRQRSLKAPAEHEPPIPEFVDTVLVVAGLSALGQPLNETWVHRPGLFTGLAGLDAGELIEPEAVVSVLSNPRGGLKNIPQEARRVALLNQADGPELEASGSKLAKQLLNPFQAAVVAALEKPEASSGQVLAVHEPVAGIVLAAGGSARLGEPKQLLEWRGKPFIRQVTEAALEAGLHHVAVVTGAHAELVDAAIKDLPVRIARNEDWEAGQSSSVRAGLEALPPEVGAALFLLADQPQVPATLIRTLVSEHSQSLAPIIAPQVDGQRGNPVLFDRSIFTDLAAIEGDVGGRALFSKQRVRWLPWLDTALTLDVDTLKDYQRLLELED